ncbi:hypothetical protein EG832_20870, partial [bacterium]|nr:hypothetical protein [bacterium]
MKNNQLKNKRFWGFVAGVIMIISLAACQSNNTATTPTVETVPTLAITQPATVPGTEVTTIPATPEAPVVLEGAVTTDSGLQYLEITAGSGKAPEIGDIVSMNYIASLVNGTELDNTYVSGVPSSTIWGMDRLLPGWEEGIGLMKVGGKAKFVIPSELAFGQTGYGVVPANAQIIIEMELLSAETPPQPTAVEDDQFTTTDTGLKYYDLIVGEGMEVLDKYTVKAQYTLWVKGESEFTYVGKSEEAYPISFAIGSGEVFPGWEEGMVGMKAGGSRLLV